MLRRPGWLESDATGRTEQESGENRPKRTDSRSLIYTARLNSVTRSKVTRLLVVNTSYGVFHWHIPASTTHPRCYWLSFAVSLFELRAIIAGRVGCVVLVSYTSFVTNKSQYTV